MEVVICNDYDYDYDYTSFWLPLKIIKKYLDTKQQSYFLYHQYPSNYIKIDDDSFLNKEYGLYDDYKEYMISNHITISYQDLGKTTEFESLIKDNNYFDIDDLILRTDKILLNIIKNNIELVPYLKIIEIPDDIKWYIERFDSGGECIHEEHRIWN